MVWRRSLTISLATRSTHVARSRCKSTSPARGSLHRQPTWITATLFWSRCVSMRTLTLEKLSSSLSSYSNTVVYRSRSGHMLKSSVSVCTGEECTPSSYYMALLQDDLLVGTLTCSTSHEHHAFATSLFRLSRNMYSFRPTIVKLSCGCCLGLQGISTSETSSMQETEMSLTNLLRSYIRMSTRILSTRTRRRGKSIGSV